MEEKKFGHIMVDIETMGKKSGSAIVSIGAVEFNMTTGETNKEFRINASLQSCIDLGLTMDPDTIMWWMKQSDDARKSLVEGEVVGIIEALVELAVFIEDCGGKECEIWGNSPRFDLEKLDAAYNKAGSEIPWDFRKERCVRTLVSFLPEIKNMTKFAGIAHDAVHDCHHQIKYCSETYRRIKNIE